MAGEQAGAPGDGVVDAAFYFFRSPYADNGAHVILGVVGVPVGDLGGLLCQQFSEGVGQ